MQLVRRFRISALCCVAALLFCELASRPYTSMGVVDDAAYILMAQHLAATGRVIYDGWVSPMLGWQLYLGAGFIKLFGFSFTAVRMSTLLIAMALAFLLQRTFVRIGVSERNSTIGSLIFVLSPLYLMLSVTYMTDIFGLFGIVLCLYGCLRALQALTDGAAIGWLCFAVVGDALCGTSRQIAWLGVLVMLPSTLWLLRGRRRVFLAGVALTLAGALFVFGCMRWLQHEPYFLPESLALHRGQEFPALSSYFHALLDAPFLLLPIIALFLTQIRRSLRRSVAVLAASAAFYGAILLVLLWKHINPGPLLEPTMGTWVTIYGLNSTTALQGTPPIFLPAWIQIVLTVASLGSVVGLIVSVVSSRRTSLVVPNAGVASWMQLGVLFVPFSVVYLLVLLPRATTSGIPDRYLLELLLFAVLCLGRLYQERISPRMPLAAVFLTALAALYGIACTHTMFSFYRARVALVAETQAAGIAATSIDNGWEYNIGVELQHASHLNEPRIQTPAHAYVNPPDPPPSICSMEMYYLTPHIHPQYGVSFNRDACYGPAPFAPTQYSRWPYRTPGTLYVVQFLPRAAP